MLMETFVEKWSGLEDYKTTGGVPALWRLDCSGLLDMLETVKILWPIDAEVSAEDTFWGGYAGDFQDPDGHLWEVVWNPQLAIED
jgi:hypothetical protein